MTLLAPSPGRLHFFVPDSFAARDAMADMRVVLVKRHAVLLLREGCWEPQVRGGPLLFTHLQGAVNTVRRHTLVTATLGDSLPTFCALIASSARYTCPGIILDAALHMYPLDALDAVRRLGGEELDGVTPLDRMVDAAGVGIDQRARAW